MSTELSLSFSILILNAVILAAHPLEHQKVYLLPEHVLLIISADSPWGKLASTAPAILVVVKPNELMPGDVLQSNIPLVRNNVKAWYCNTRSSFLARSSGGPDLWVQMIIDKDSQRERDVQRRRQNQFFKGDDVFYARLNLIHLRGLEAGVGKRICSRLLLPYRRLLSARDNLESELVLNCRHCSDLIDSTSTITSAPGPAYVAHTHMLCSLITAFLASHPNFFLNLAIFFLVVAFLAAALYFTIE